MIMSSNFMFINFATLWNNNQQYMRGFFVGLFKNV